MTAPPWLKQLPNALTTLRLILALPIAWLILQQQFVAVLVLVFVAGGSDLVDGWLARRLNALSRYGAVADPLSDKALLMSTYICLALVGAIPAWLAWVVVGRDLVILGGAASYHWLFGRYEMAPSLWGKACTLVQVVFALMVLVQNVEPLFPNDLFPAATWLLLALTLISGGNYVKVWGRKALDNWSQPGQ